MIFLAMTATLSKSPTNEDGSESMRRRKGEVMLATNLFVVLLFQRSLTECSGEQHKWYVKDEYTSEKSGRLAMSYGRSKFAFSQNPHVHY